MRHDLAEQHHCEAILAVEVPIDAFVVGDAELLQTVRGGQHLQAAHMLGSPFMSTNEGRGSCMDMGLGALAATGLNQMAIELFILFRLTGD